MFRTISLSLIVLAFAYLASSPSSLTAQTVSQSETSPENRWATLPTDRALRGNRGVDSLVYPSAPTTAFQDAETVEPDLCLDGKPPFDVKKLLRPRGDVFAEWEPEADGIAISSFDVSGEMPVYPVFGPPPFIRAGYSHTQIIAPAEADLPPLTTAVASDQGRTVLGCLTAGCQAQAGYPPACQRECHQNTSAPFIRYSRSTSLPL
jgi:hypothetical protein